MKHNCLRDAVAKVMKTAKCKDLQTEPLLLPTERQQLLSGTIIGDQARLDVSARSVWNALEIAFFDIRVFHALAPFNAAKTIPQMYQAHKGEKERRYNASGNLRNFHPTCVLHFWWDGLRGTQAEKETRTETGQRYSDAVTFIRKRLRFELLKTTVIALRGERGARIRSFNEIPMEKLDLNLEPFV